MPSAQVVNFGQNTPEDNSIGTFAKGFLTTLNDRSSKRRNDEIFTKIKSKYGPDAKPEDIFKDVIESEGLDQDYKRNKLDEIKDYAELSTKTKKNLYDQAMLDVKKDELQLERDKLNKPKKTDAEKPITPYQRKALRNASIRLDQDKQRLEQAAKTEDRKLPEYVSKYTTSILKDEDVKLPARDKADLNNFIEQLMTDKENPMGVNEAFDHAMDYIEARRERVDNYKITPKPTAWIGKPNPNEVVQSADKAFQELKALHDEDGVDSQKDLREIARKGGWSDEEITGFLQRIFQQAGKKLRGPQTKTAQQSAEIPFEKQGQASEAAGIDDILFGE